MACEELSVEVVTQAIRIAQGVSRSRTGAPARSLARVTRVVRVIENDADTTHDLTSLHNWRA